MKGPGVGRFSVRVSGDSALAVQALGPTWAFVDAVAPTGAAVLSSIRVRRDSKRAMRLLRLIRASFDFAYDPASRHQVQRRVLRLRSLIALAPATPQPRVHLGAARRVKALDWSTTSDASTRQQEDDDA